MCAVGLLEIGEILPCTEFSLKILIVFVGQKLLELGCVGLV
jgi:hypothetical protein